MDTQVHYIFLHRYYFEDWVTKVHFVPRSFSINKQTYAASRICAIGFAITLFWEFLLTYFSVFLLLVIERSQSSQFDLFDCSVKRVIQWKSYQFIPNWTAFQYCMQKFFRVELLFDDHYCRSMFWQNFIKFSLIKARSQPKFNKKSIFSKGRLNFEKS